VSGSTITDDSTVLFANVDTSDGNAMVTVTPPSGDCTGPGSVTLNTTGGVTSTFFACE
jgi:hypothetical protein